MIKHIPFVPDGYINAAELAAAGGYSLRWAQKIIKRCSDAGKIKVGHTIYAHVDALHITRRRGNPHLQYDSYHQQCAAAIRWHPEHKTALRQEMRRNRRR